MSSAAQQYMSELHDEFGFLATWTPGMRMALGDIGVVDDEQGFLRVTALEEFGIGFKDVPAGAGTESFQYASAGGVEIALKLAGAVSPLVPNVPVDQAGLGVRFSRKHATVFRADGATQHRIANEVALAAEIASLIRDGRWDRDWSIVTHLVRAATTTALVARSAGSGVEFALSAGVQAGGLELLSADAGARAVSSREMQVTIVGTGGATPLYRARRVKRRWFSRKVELRATFSDEFEQLNPAEDENDEDLFEDTPVYGRAAATEG